jgi:hypothetical protein
LKQLIKKETILGELSDEEDAKPEKLKDVKKEEIPVAKRELVKAKVEDHPKEANKPIESVKEVAKPVLPEKEVKKQVDPPKEAIKHKELPAQVKIEKAVVPPKVASKVVDPPKKEVQPKEVVKPKTSGVIGDSSDDEKPVKKKEQAKVQVSSKGSNSTHKPSISHNQVPQSKIKQAVVFGDSSSDEEEPTGTRDSKNINVKEFGDDSSEESDKRRAESDDEEGKDEVREDMFEQTLKVKAQSSTARKTIATGAEATRLMFEKQLAEMMRMQNPNYKPTKNIDDDNTGNKTKINI